MMTAANELLQAVCARLAGDAALAAEIGDDGIHDRLIARRPFPYLVIGEIETRDYSTSTEKGEEHFFTIAVWAAGPPRRLPGACVRSSTMRILRLQAACSSISGTSRHGQGARRRRSSMSRNCGSAR